MLAGSLAFSLIAVVPLPAAAASTQSASASSDALTALGINSSAAPDGYDPDSIDNPYGRNTIEVTPVSELYTVGLSQEISFDPTVPTDSSDGKESGTKTVSAEKTYTNTLTSSLTGHAAWGQTTTKGILTTRTETDLTSGTTSTTGEYAVITSGTYSSSDSSHATTGYLTGALGGTTALSDGTAYAMSDVAAGAFDKNTDGLTAQIAMVYTKDYSKNGGLYLRFGDAVSGSFGDPIELLSTSKSIGNPTLPDEDDASKLVENFAENPYQLKNYLQVATGDWNGDDVDEVAVYIPEVGNSRIVVYALQTLETDQASTAYKNPKKWGVAWTYYLREGSVVSNMVSLVSGDVNQDGMDDLACTWGYYYGPNQNVGSKAVVMFGGKGTSILKASQQFDLTFGTSNIVRASFVFGDMAGSGEESLILCGQSDADLKSGNTTTRYVALYAWNGSAFTSTIYQDFDLFGKEDGTYLWPAMSDTVRGGDADHFYSLPLCAANTAIITRPIGEDGGDLLYFDSLVISYTDSGLNIEESWDNTTALQSSAHENYVEYNACAGDLTGQTGTGALVTSVQTMSTSTENSTSYTEVGEHQEPVYARGYYYKNWFYKFIGKKTWYSYIASYKTVTDTTTVPVKYNGYTAGSTYLAVVDRAETLRSLTRVNNSVSPCLANTDKDSSYMNYSGTHYYTYTDPRVLAVLASPPYFSDLLNRDDLSGNYAESSTSYASSTSSGSGSTGSTTITAGAYVSYEQDFKVFGITVASIEAEATITAGFTWETEHTSTLEQTVTYSASAGEDKVAFYSIPMEIYEYTSYVPDGSGGYKEVLTTVNIPHEASVGLMGLDDYEAIAADYSVLPAIADGVLTHTLGDPSSYPSSTKKYSDAKTLIAAYSGDPAKVGFTSAAGGSTITQEIAMSEEKSNAYIGTASIDTKAGAGAGGIKVGVVAGFEGGGGTVTVSTSGSSFSGELQDMPSEAQAYGYGMNWRIFCYEYHNGTTAFPVVSYVVTDDTQPAPLPQDFTQDIASTGSDSITLTWTYDKMVSGFQIYRYYEFPDGEGSYRLKYVPFKDAVSKDADGNYVFRYTDTGLSPYTEYSYQIQTESASKPQVSIYSQPLVCRTKTATGYPAITVDGLNEDGALAIYPDTDGTASIKVSDAGQYSGLSYQWQKLAAGSWSDISGAKTASYTISNASSSDQGTYRCRVNAIYYDADTGSNYYISAYSDAFVTAYTKRTPSTELKLESTLDTTSTGQVVKGLHAEVRLHSANVGNMTAPTGTVTFLISGTDYEYSKTVALATSNPITAVFYGESKYYATASLDLTGLSDGAYTVNTYYSGDRVFKDSQSSLGELVVVGNATGYQLSLSKTDGGSAVTKFTYGDTIYPMLRSMSSGSNDYVTERDNVTYQLVKDGATADFSSGSQTPDAGSYTLQASKAGTVVAQVGITVVPKAITVQAQSRDNVSADTVAENPPVITCASLTEQELAALKLTWVTKNSAGNSVTLANGSDPGNYTVTPCPSEQTPSVLYANYDVTYVSGVYTIVGLTYRLTVLAADYTDKSGTRSVGTAGISNASQTYADYTSGTTVTLFAQPNSGYMVDHWTIAYGSDIRTSGGDTGNENRLTVSTQAVATTVTVTFKVKPIVLTAYTDAGGAVECLTDAYFQSGAYVSSGAEFTFRAVPAAGYHFKSWQVGVVGSSSTAPAGTMNDDGSNDLELTVGTNSITVKAVFERDSYVLTLDGDLTAYYMRQNPSDPTGAPIKTVVSSGKTVPGDTALIVTPKTGYQAAEGATFVVNQAATDEAAEYHFTMLEDTTVSLLTQRNRYPVTASAEHGTVTVSVDGAEVGGSALDAVEGGSFVKFTAYADRGYRFDHWVINGVDDTTTSTDVLPVPALGQATSVTAVFTANAAHTVTASVYPESRGTMLYTLCDIYGNVVDDAESPFPAGGLTLYSGESILCKVLLSNGSMVEQWVCNGTSTTSSAKTYPGGPIPADSDIDLEVYLVSSSSYDVAYLSADESLGTLSATADGTDFASQTTVSGGSDVVLTAAPAAGYMVDHWTVTPGNLAQPEETAPLQADGVVYMGPVCTIDGLHSHTTVRAYFTALSTNPVEVIPSDSGQGVITYVTPLTADDAGTRSSSAEALRSGGTVVLTLTPTLNYTVTVQELEAILESAVNPDAVVAVSCVSGVYTVTIRNLTQPLSLSTQALFRRTYSVTVPEYVTANVQRAEAGEAVILTVAPASSYVLSALTLSSGTLNEPVSSGTLLYTFTMPAEDVTVTAAFTYQNSGGSETGGGGGGSTPAAGGTQKIDLSDTSGTALSVSVSVADGSAAVDMDLTKLQALLSAGTGLLTLDLSGQDGVTAVSLQGAALAALSRSDGLAVVLDGSSIQLSPEALTTISTASGASDTVTISMAQASYDSLSGAQKELIPENSRILSLSLTSASSDGTVRQIHALGGTATLSVAYKLGEGESGDRLTVYYVTEDGAVEKLSGSYDPSSGMATFQVTHFSTYVLVQEYSKSFADVCLGDWYYDEVNTALKSGWFHGTSSGAFSPQGLMDRAMLVTVLYRMSGSPTVHSQSRFTDVSAASWYADAVCWAADNGIVKGCSDGTFLPTAGVTRQEMATILYRYDQWRGNVPAAGPALDGFADASSISDWAYDAMSWANGDGLIQGTSESTLSPASGAARAQVAVILARYAQGDAEITLP